MNIVSVSGENFLTLSKFEIELSERGLLLVQGENKDDSSAESNGAGKSSVADAICWALYGVTARGVASDAVVNKTAKKDCFVEVTLSDGADEYRITRYRKHATYKNQAIVLQKSKNPGEAPIELHKGTERETQEVIDKVVGCSLEVFTAAVYAGQEKMPDLPAMTDKQLKLMIEEAAGVEVLAKAHLKAREKFNLKAGEMTVAQSRIDMAANNKKVLQDDLEGSEVGFKHHEDNRKPLAKAELSKVVPIKAEIDTLNDEIASLKETDVLAELAVIDTKFSSLRAESNALEEFKNAAAAFDRTFTLAQSAAATAKRKHADAVEALRTVDDKVGKPCGECGKDYCEHDIEAAKKLRTEDVAKAEAELRSAATVYKKAKTDAEEAQKRATEFKASMTDTTEMARRRSELNAVLSTVEAYKKQVTAKTRDIEDIKSKAKSYLEAPNPFTKIIELQKAKIEQNDAILTKATAEKVALEEEYELLDSAVKVFGPAGVRAHILDTVTPYLNDRTSHYLSALADGNIHAVWNTLAKSAKGELKEKFNIEVVNDKGAESFSGLSGGEKRKVRLATAMALQDMVASRATKPINIFVADEVDHALDESGLERLMTVLNDKATERGTVMVISHNSLADWIDNVITVKKESGFGTLSGATRA